MKADWEPRVSRLEMGFCAAFVLIFAAIITCYLLLNTKIDSQVQLTADLKGDVRVLNERTAHMDNKLDAIGNKLGVP